MTELDAMAEVWRAAAEAYMRRHGIAGEVVVIVESDQITMHVYGHARPSHVEGIRAAVVAAWADA